MTVRVRDPALARDLAAHLRAHGFLVTERDRRELDIHLLNQVSDRYDQAKAQTVIAAWVSLHEDGSNDKAVEII
jgi:hypothetical protein